MYCAETVSYSLRLPPSLCVGIMEKIVENFRYLLLCNTLMNGATSAYIIVADILYLPDSEKVVQTP